MTTDPLLNVDLWAGKVAPPSSVWNDRNRVYTESALSPKVLENDARTAMHINLKRSGFDKDVSKGRYTKKRIISEGGDKITVTAVLVPPAGDVRKNNATVYYVVRDSRGNTLLNSSATLPTDMAIKNAQEFVDTYSVDRTRDSEYPPRRARKSADILSVALWAGKATIINRDERSAKKKGYGRRYLDPPTGWQMNTSAAQTQGKVGYRKPKGRFDVLITAASRDMEADPTTQEWEVQAIALNPPSSGRPFVETYGKKARYRGLLAATRAATALYNSIPNEGKSADVLDVALW